jgi:CBS domain-containing protein
MSWNVASVMTREVVTVAPEAAYKEVVARMQELRVSAVPVVDADRHVLGIVSEADLLLKEERPVPRPGGRLLDPHGSAAKATARDAAALMTSPALTVRPEATLTEAARLMHRNHVKRLPVVDGEERLLGIVSRADLLKAFIRSDESIAREVREELVERTLAIDPEALSVAVAAGVVRLTGELETRSLARILVRLASSVEGVVGVEDRLRWRLDDTDLGMPTPPLAIRYSAGERDHS